MDKQSVGLLDCRKKLLERRQSASIKNYDFIKKWEGPWIAPEFFILYQGTQIQSPFLGALYLNLSFRAALNFRAMIHAVFSPFPSYYGSLGRINTISQGAKWREPPCCAYSVTFVCLIFALALSPPHLICIPFSFLILACVCACVFQFGTQGSPCQTSI